MIGISEDDRERIREFNERPWYEKDPDILLPDDDGDDAAESE